MSLNYKIRTVIACLFWGSAFVGGKIAFQYSDYPIFISGLRFSLAGLLVVPVILFNKINIREQMKHWRFMLLLAFVQTFLQYGLFFMGLNKVPGAISAIVIGAGPLFVALMAHISLKNEKLNLRKSISIAVGISGVIFISLANKSIADVNPAFYAGIGLLLLSNMIGSYTNIMIVKRKANNMSPVVMTSFANIFGGIMLLLAAYTIEKPEFVIYPAGFYMALVWLALIPAVSLSIWYGLLQHPGVKVSELNVWKFLVPVTGCILSWLILSDESPTVPSVLGIVIIITSLWLLQKPKKREIN